MLSHDYKLMIFMINFKRKFSILCRYLKYDPLDMKNIDYNEKDNTWSEISDNNIYL